MVWLVSELSIAGSTRCGRLVTFGVLGRLNVIGVLKGINLIVGFGRS
jgi:hypothetical protein